MKINNLNDFITPGKAFSKIPDIADISSYESPIRMIVSEMETQMEKDTLTAIQRYGIDVDKEELIKALNYDRRQYEKGYAYGFEAGRKQAKEDLINLIKNSEI